MAPLGMSEVGAPGRSFRGRRSGASGIGTARGAVWERTGVDRTTGPKAAWALLRAECKLLEMPGGTCCSLAMAGTAGLAIVLPCGSAAELGAGGSEGSCCGAGVAGLFETAAGFRAENRCKVPRPTPHPTARDKTAQSAMIRIHLLESRVGAMDCCSGFLPDGRVFGNKTSGPAPVAPDSSDRRRVKRETAVSWAGFGMAVLRGIAPARSPDGKSTAASTLALRGAGPPWRGATAGESATSVEPWGGSFES